MKTVTITKNLYNFEELDEQAKECVRQWYLDDPARADIFTEDITESFLYEVDDEEIKECCQANEWFFTEDGKLY